MIQNFAHQGLERFFLTGDLRGIQPKHSARLTLILTALDAADVPMDMNLPGFQLQPLKGEEKGVWSVKVSGNWRVTFRFENGNAYGVNYQDYH